MSTINASPLLINESPLQLLPSLAVKLGNIHEAIILQTLQNELQKSNKEIDGRKWVAIPIRNWKNYFPWLSEKSIETRFGALKEKNIIVCSKFNQKNLNQTNWYSINYDVLNDLLEKK